MAPEQREGERVDARADVFSLGCVLYELLTGAMPLRNLPSIREEMPPIREVAPEVPAKFDEIVARALEENPDERYQSAGDLGIAAVAAAERHSIGRTEGPTPVRVFLCHSSSDKAEVRDLYQRLSLDPPHSVGGSVRP